MRTQSLAMLLVLAVNLFLVFGAGESWAQIVALSRESNYVINSDASYQYEANLLLKNYNSDNPAFLEDYFTVFSQTAAVSTTGFNSFEWDHSNNSYKVDYEFQYTSPLGSPYLTKTFPADIYHFSVVLGPKEERAVSILYSGGAGTWADKSTNVNLPWEDQTGYWEFAGGGSWNQYIDNYTVNVILPETAMNVNILGWNGNDPQQLAYNKFQFTNYYSTPNLDVNLAFKTTAPLPPATVTPEPISSALFLLGGALLGIGTLRKKK